MSEEKRYLDFPAGESQCWLINVSFVRGTNDKPRNKFQLHFAEKPTEETFECAGTRQDVIVPVSSDSTQAKIAMERRIKSVLYPLAGLQPDAKTTLKALYETISNTLKSHDLQVVVNVKLTEGKSLNKDGEPIMFTEILSLNPIGFKEKKEFVSSIDCSDDELPF